MCGIFALVFKDKFDIEKKSDYEEAFGNISHRGPDYSILTVVNDKCIFGFHRLSVNDVSEDGNQPFVQNDRVTMVNGEIYNHEDLKNVYDLDTKGGSDCEVVGLLLNKLFRMNVFEQLDGVFAGVSVKGNSVVAFRDPIGIRPLFYVETDEFIGFASEAKALVPLSKNEVKIFPIGKYWCDGIFTDYCFPYNFRNTSPLNTDTLRHLLIQSVEKRVKNCDRELGFFLSGGLDSSLVACIANNLMPDKTINTFSIGMDVNSPDLRYAAHVAYKIKSNHHEVIFSLEEGISAIKDVIYQCETYDCTTIRASIPMYLLSKYIKKQTDVRVVLSGEGADELFGGYLYFHNAPSVDEFTVETERLINNVHMFDGLRADRATAAWGLEVRVPFFDRNLISYIRSLHGDVKMPSCTGVEKFILRSAFDGYPNIPSNVLWRQKDAFSDAVGYSWVSTLKSITEGNVTDFEFNNRHVMFPEDTPQTKEDYYYRVIYNDIYGNKSLGSKGKWLPKWVGDIKDPSATYLKVHTCSKV